MDRVYSWSWVEAQVSQTIDVWNSCAPNAVPVRVPDGPRYCSAEQQRRENAYDEGLRAVELEAKWAGRTRAQRLEARRRIVAVFPPFAAIALGLEDDAISLITDGFLPVGTQLARWATRFDATLSMPDTIQACRNAWSACGMQPLLGDRMRLTPSILGYSLLYPYSDNYLDHEKVSTAKKLQFSGRFRDRLCGQRLSPRNHHEAAVWAMVQLIEEQYPRLHFPQVFDTLLAIHQAQENSLAQLKKSAPCGDFEVLRISCAKGGTSVLADACISHGWLNPEEGRFAFEWGVLLQLGDDLQDVLQDLRHGSVTLFSSAAEARIPLDNLVVQLLNFGDRVAARMDNLSHDTAILKDLLGMSWRSLILMAVANAHELFSPAFLAELEPSSPFRFDFLRARHKKQTGRRGLFKVLFDAFVEAGDADNDELPPPEDWMEYTRDPSSNPIALKVELDRSVA